MSVRIKTMLPNLCKLSLAPSPTTMDGARPRRPPQPGTQPDDPMEEDKKFDLDALPGDMMSLIFEMVFSNVGNEKATCTRVQQLCAEFAFLDCKREWFWDALNKRFGWYGVQYEAWTDFKLGVQSGDVKYMETLPLFGFFRNAFPSAVGVTKHTFRPPSKASEYFNYMCNKLSEQPDQFVRRLSANQKTGLIHRFDTRDQPNLFVPFWIEMVLYYARGTQFDFHEIEPQIRFQSRDLALALVKADAAVLRHLGPAFRNDVQVVTTAVSTNGLALEWALDAMRNDPAVVEPAVRSNPDAIRFVGAGLREDRRAYLPIAKLGIGGYVRPLNEFPGFGWLKNNPEFMWQAIARNPNRARMIGDVLKNSPEFLMKLVRSTLYIEAGMIGTRLAADRNAYRPIVLEMLDLGRWRYNELPALPGYDWLENDYEFMLTLVTRNANNGRFIGRQLSNNFQFMFESVSAQPASLGYTGDDLKSDAEQYKELVMKVIQLTNKVPVDSLKQTALADDFDFLFEYLDMEPELIRIVSRRLMANSEEFDLLAEKAISKDINVIRLLRNTRFSNDLQLMQRAVSTNERLFIAVGNELRSNTEAFQELVLTSLPSARRLSEILPQEWRNDVDLMMEAIQANPFCIQLVGSVIKEDKTQYVQLATVAFEKNPNVIQEIDDDSLAVLFDDAGFALAAVQQNVVHTVGVSKRLQKSLPFLLQLYEIDRLPDEWLSSFSNQQRRPDRHHQGRTIEQIALSAVKKDASILESLPNRMSGSIDFMKKLMDIKVEYAKYAASSLGSNPEWISTLISKRTLVDFAMQTMSEKLKESILRGAVVLDVPDFQEMLVNKGRSNLFIATSAVVQDLSNLEHVGQTLRQDRDQFEKLAIAVAESRMNIDTEAFVEKFLTPVLMNDAYLKSSKPFAEATVQRNGLLLRNFDESVRDDENIVLLAVKQDWFALEHASAALKRDVERFRDVVITALIRSRGDAWEFVYLPLRQDPQIQNVYERYRRR